MFTLYQWISIIGIPSITSMLGWAITQIVKIRKENRARTKDQETKITLLMTAHQTQLRDTLMNKYKKFMKYGGITAEDMELWEAMYQSYHSLGKNGVMDTRRQQLLELPVVDDYV